MHNVDGQRIPTKVDMESWVTLNVGTLGVWARDTHLHGGPTVRCAYKGHIVDWKFKVRNGGREVSGSRCHVCWKLRWPSSLTKLYLEG